MEEIKIGQKLYREIRHRSLPDEIKEVEVSRIGRTYFYLKGYDDRYPINKETLKYQDKVYSQAGFQLYRTLKEIEDKNERGKLLDTIRKHFSGYGQNTDTLEQLRAINNILNHKH